MNVADGKFKSLEDFTLEENESIQKELEGRQWAEFEMQEVITSLECQLIEALDIIEMLKAEVKALKEGVEVGGSASPDRDREARVSLPSHLNSRASVMLKMWKTLYGTWRITSSVVG